MKKKATVFKEHSTALLTIGSVIAGTFNCLFYYVYGIGAYVYFIMVLCQYFGHSFCVNPSMLAAA